jgi:hypothetical protein
MIRRIPAPVVKKVYVSNESITGVPAIAEHPGSSGASHHDGPPAVTGDTHDRLSREEACR